MYSKKEMKCPSLKYTHSKDFKKAPKTQNPYLQCLGAPHIDSFNYILEEGLELARADLVCPEFELPTGERVKISIDQAAFSKPNVPVQAVGVKNQKIFPTECRQRAATYKGDFKIRITFNVNGKCISLDRSLGQIPIMVKSKACHLADMSPEELIKHNEHPDEWGGYFVVKIEGADAVMVQELLLPGHLYLQVLKERLQGFLVGLKLNILRKYQTGQTFVFTERDLQMLLRKVGDIDKRMETFISTGNAPSNNVTLTQYKGLTIMAENINRMRYMAHFK
ncbi:DNA-directed RNA polymerase I subunit RPA2 [Eumeta japonica]|uniref:DNA-directed RNA polymerase n=1 Tax=Eumeta variegata TaxID=151549 RepID=A0A4C1TZ09_EUMVA|nr:DNA-directed RNA polymerase I subunit RPA2 [Eumeta japonica]